jgi:hypothetical protein
MMTPEEARILTHLRRHGTCPFSSLPTHACLEWTERTVSNLEWLGCVVVFHDRAGRPTSVQITPAGLERLCRESRRGHPQLAS